MSNTDSIKKLILTSKKAAAEDMTAIHSQVPLTKDFFREKLRGFVLHKFLLTEEELPTENFNEITDLSMSKSMKISPELVKEFDLAQSCDGVSSAMAKKVLLFMAIQRELGIELPAMGTARLKTLDELVDLAWNEVVSAKDWQDQLNAVSGPASPDILRQESVCETGQKSKKSEPVKNRIELIQDQIISDFLEIGDSFDQYAYLIELAVQLPPMNEEAKTEANLVQGCQSHVWLDIHCEKGILYFSSDSDTLIVKGILYLLSQMFNGQSCRDIADTEVTFLSETAIMDTFESGRQKGIEYVIRTLREAAKNEAAQ